MNALKAVINILHSDSTLTGLLGGNKVYPLQAPEGEDDKYCIVAEISTDPSYTKDGNSLLDACRIQIDTYTKKYSDVVDISTRIRTVLEPFSGTQNGVEVSEIRFLTNNETYIPDHRLYQRVTDYEVRIKNPN